MTPTLDILARRRNLCRRRGRYGGAHRYDGWHGSRHPPGARRSGVHQQTGILSYAVKYASAFYGPFREAAEWPPKFGDRKSHQMDPANVREALRELELDVREGADMVMVKPALPYLDVIRQVRQATHLPIAGLTTSAANMPCSKRLLPTAGWMSAPRCWNPDTALNAPERT